MDSKLKEIFQENAISEDVRKSIESAGWTTIRLFSKVFSSDSDAKDKAAAKFKFVGVPDEEVTAAKIALAWEDAVSAAKALKQEKEDAHAPSEGTHKSDLMEKQWMSAHDGATPPMQTKGSPALLGI